MTRSIAVAILIIPVMISCESDLDIYASGEPLPIVYCILDLDNPTQQLRLTRSFNIGNPNESAINGDSLMFTEALEIILEQVENNVVSKSASFIPVQVAKDSGFFPNAEHWVYQAKMDIIPNTDYQIVIYISEYERLVYSTCLTISPFEILNPSFPEVRAIHLQPGYNPTFFWTPGANSGVYQLGFIFHYDEYQGEQVERKTVDIALNTLLLSATSDGYFSQSINSTNFYWQLAELLIPDSGLFRKSRGLVPYIVSGGNELADQIRLQNAGNSFSIVSYSNISNGIGLFSSKIKIESSLFNLTDQTIDSIAYGQFTHALNFLDRNDQRKGMQ